MGWTKWRPSGWPKSKKAGPKPKRTCGATWFPPHEFFKTSLEMHYSALADLHATVVDTTGADENKLEAEFDKLKKILSPGDEQLDSVIDDVLSLQTRLSPFTAVVAAADRRSTS